MKKIALCSMFFTVLFSCKKQDSTDKQVEDSKQLLKKVALTSTTGPSYDVVTYQYNSEGGMIAEGSKTYVRDEKQRIVHILETATPTNRADIQVYYSSPESNKIAYTLCTLVDGDARDSVVYVRDNAGRIERKLTYFSYLTKDKLPVETYLSHYQVFVYDESGNLLQMDDYNLYLGKFYHCGQLQFSEYDNMTNPQYANDEVRVMENFKNGALNASKNNFTRNNSIAKAYTYRADGRPRSCVVRSATQKFTLTFEYQ